MMMKLSILTMAARGELYIIIFSTAPKNPIALTRASPCNANRVTRIVAARKPTSKIPTRMAILACHFQK